MTTIMMPIAFFAGIGLGVVICFYVIKGKL